MKVKVCSKCKVEKSELEFNKRKRSKDGLNSYCKVCNKEKLKIHYQENKDLYYEKSKNYFKKLQEWFTEFKSTLKCSICGESRHWVLDFHHTDPSIKDGNIANMLNTSSKEKILDEVKKCIVLCSNCHRDLHYHEKLKFVKLLA